MSSIRRSCASRRFPSWVRWRRATIRIAPSVVSRRPLRARSRALTPLASAVLRSRSKRSCAAVATLLTFWPPGPAERTNESDNSLSGISTPSATRSDKSGALQGRTLVGRPVETHRSLRDRRGRRLHRARPEDAGVLLSDRNRHAVGAEDAPDRAVHVRAHVVDPVHGIGDPEAHLEQHAVRLEADEARDRRRVARDARVGFRRLAPPP